MKKFRCFVIDDEPLAIDVIVNYLTRLKQFEIVGKFTDPLMAHGSLKENDVDLIFLDIEMPEFNGLDFIKTLVKKPEIIITTAYRDFAVEGFELNILDYLVKPIEFDRFMLAIDKFYDRKPKESEDDYLIIRADRKFVKINHANILYIEGIKDYVKIITDDGQHMTKESIGNFYSRLPKDHFLRVHKSFIVAKSRITAHTHKDVELDKIEIPIGRIYKEEFLLMMK